MNKKNYPPRIHEIGNLYGYKIGSGFAGAVYLTDGISPTLHAHSGGNTMPFILLEYADDIAVAPTVNPT